MAWMKYTISATNAIREPADPIVCRAACMPTRHVLSTFATDERGLSERQVHEARNTYGPNIIVPERRDSIARRVVRAFATPFTLILIALAIISLYTNVYLAAPGENDPSTACIIAAMVLISGGISLWQDARGAHTAEALRSLISTNCRCIRSDIGSCEIPCSDVVRGDLIELSAGDIIPADLRIITATNLLITQATLTGESDPVEKTSDVIEPFSHAPKPAETPSQSGPCLDDYTNIAFAGTFVQSGKGIGLSLIHI